MPLIFAAEYTVVCPACGERQAVRAVSTDPDEFMHELLDESVCPCGRQSLDAFRTNPGAKMELLDGAW